ncbi:MAG: hypothetical protein LN413_00660 [Candidatus Thermoplasmatota archaeon]|nr:hypothetical protein [Candidatus Thermoplasmatota archaeon]
MPGPGHDHSAKFERCLDKVKVPAGRDPGEYKHRICYTSVGKAVMDWFLKKQEAHPEVEAETLAGKDEPGGDGEAKEADLDELEGVVSDILDQVSGGDADSQATSKKLEAEVQTDEDLEVQGRGPGPNEMMSDAVGIAKGDSQHVHIRLQNFELIKGKKGGKRWFEGWGSVQVKDKQGDVITSEEWEPILPLLRKRYNRFFDSHTDLMLGEFTDFEIRDKEVEVKGEDGNIGKEMQPGLWFRGFFYEDYTFQKEAWEKFKGGEYGGFSLRGGATGMKMACSDKACTDMIRVPVGLEVAAFSIVRSPANAEATAERHSLAKSAYSSPFVEEAASEIVKALEDLGLERPAYTSTSIGDGAVEIVNAIRKAGLTSTPEIVPR